MYVAIIAAGFKICQQSCYTTETGLANHNNTTLQLQCLMRAMCMVTYHCDKCYSMFWDKLSLFTKAKKNLSLEAARFTYIRFLIEIASTCVEVYNYAGLFHYIDKRIEIY